METSSPFAERPTSGDLSERMFNFFVGGGGGRGRRRRCKWAKFQAKAQIWILTGRLRTHMRDLQVGVISGILLDNLRELVYMQLQEAIRHKMHQS